MGSQLKWGVAVFIVGVAVFALIDGVFPVGAGEDTQGNTILKVIYSIPLILFGVAIIFFRKREGTIEQIKGGGL